MRFQRLLGHSCRKKIKKRLLLKLICNYLVEDTPFDKDSIELINNFAKYRKTLYPPKKIAPKQPFLDWVVKYQKQNPIKEEIIPIEELEDEPINFGKIFPHDNKALIKDLKAQVEQHQQILYQFQDLVSIFRERLSEQDKKIAELEEQNKKISLIEERYMKEVQRIYFIHNNQLRMANEFQQLKAASESLNLRISQQNVLPMEEKAPPIQQQQQTQQQHQLEPQQQYQLEPQQQSQENKAEIAVQTQSNVATNDNDVHEFQTTRSIPVEEEDYESDEPEKKINEEPHSVKQTTTDSINSTVTQTTQEQPQITATSSSNEPDKNQDINVPTQDANGLQPTPASTNKSNKLKPKKSKDSLKPAPTEEQDQAATRNSPKQKTKKLVAAAKIQEANEESSPPAPAPAPPKKKTKKLKNEAALEPLPTEEEDQKNQNLEAPKKTKITKKSKKANGDEVATIETGTDPTTATKKINGKSTEKLDLAPPKKMKKTNSKSTNVDENSNQLDKEKTPMRRNLRSSSKETDKSKSKLFQ